MSQPQKKMISSFTSQNVALITPLILFCLQLRLVYAKIHRFVEDSPRKFFNSALQSAVVARRQRDENSDSSVVVNEDNEAPGH